LDIPKSVFIQEIAMYSDVMGFVFCDF